MPPTPPIVRLENVDVDIDGRPVLHGIHLTLAAGRHLGVVGGNGSGKSTLLALLAGRRWPAPGRGRRVYDFGAGPERDAVTARTRVALIGHELQDLYFARGWNFRVRDVVHSGFTRSDIPRRARTEAGLRAAAALLERMRLTQLADRRLLELSRGEQRRVLITRALAFEPALLLLDEPASGLDTASRQALEDTLEQAARLTTIVVAAHRIDELPAIVTRMATLDAGRLELHDAARAPADTDPADTDPTDTTLANVALADANDPTPAASGRSHAVASPDGKTLIALERASVWLDGRPVLEALDWQLRRGEHWLVTGPNGAGKSTLLRLLHGELRPAVGGSIRWPGLGDPADVWTLRRRISLVSPELQARYLYPTTVFDAVASGLRASIGLTRQPTRPERERVGRLLAEFGLEALGDRLLGTLSYGQRHRALIARTLVTEPRILLLDEPWEGLDAATTTLVRDAIAVRMRAELQVVCVSHVGARGLPLNRGLALAAGRISDAGDTGAPRGSSASARIPATDSRPR